MAIEAVTAIKVVVAAKAAKIVKIVEAKAETAGVVEQYKRVIKVAETSN